MEQVTKCPYCAGTYPHQAPTGCLDKPPYPDGTPFDLTTEEEMKASFGRVLGRWTDLEQKALRKEDSDAVRTIRAAINVVKLCFEWTSAEGYMKLISTQLAALQVMRAIEEGLTPLPADPKPGLYGYTEPF